MQDFLSQLNPSQREAVEHITGASLIIAGAGSGKTRVLTYKIAYLLTQGFAPYSILSLTFTNKAAKEMKERISLLVGPESARNLWMGTFHSIFARILRTESTFLGFPSSFTIYDQTDSRSLIKSIIKDLKLDDKVYKPSYVQSRISLSKNNLITAQSYALNDTLTKTDGYNKVPRIQEIYRIYSNRCKQAGAMDFDDLLLYTNILFRDHPESLEKYRNRFKFILVDEYQDTNMAQYLIVKKLAELNERICVVGDDAQSIYSFRGAQLDNILRYPNDFKACKVFKLEQNYRSTKNIVNAANSIINKNKEQFEKNNFSENDDGEKIKLTAAYSDMEESYVIANSILDLRLRDHYSFSDFAILYRTNAQSRVFEESLRKRNIPYKIYGGLSFYQRKEIKDLLAYFRLTINPNDGEAFKRIINYPARGIGKTTLDTINAASLQHQVTAWNIISSPDTYLPTINKGTKSKLAGFYQLINGFQNVIEQSSAFDIAHDIATRSGILKEFKADRSVENISRLENVEELLNAVKEFSESKKEAGEENGLVYFLEDVSLLTNQDNEKDEDRDKVTLMTIHASKGLEFSNVFISGLEEDLFPSQMSKDNPKELEEERRLFYVAVTRAKTNCMISYAKSRYKYGVPVFPRPSQFLKDIDSKYVDKPLELQGRQNTDSTDKQRPAFGSRFTRPSAKPITERVPVQRPPQNFKRANTASPVAPPSSGENFKSDPLHLLRPGIRVEHLRFGMGQLEAIEGTDANKKAVVNFDNAGQKTLLLRFAKLRIVK